MSWFFFLNFLLLSFGPFFKHGLLTAAKDSVDFSRSSPGRFFVRTFPMFTVHCIGFQGVLFWPKNSTSLPSSTHHHVSRPQCACGRFLTCYTPENSQGYPKSWRFGRWCSFSVGSFSGSHVNLPGCNLFWSPRCTSNMNPVTTHCSSCISNDGKSHSHGRNSNLCIHH